jgi:tetratricopeptide (TPR) repeat protein
LVVTCLFVPFVAADDSEMADLYYKAGDKALKAGNTEKATEQFRKALKSYPAHADAVVALGDMLFEDLDVSGLVKLFGEWLKVFKGLPNPTEKQIEVSNRLTSRLEDLRVLERTDRKFSKKYAALGKSLKRKDKAAAVRNYETALALDPSNSSAAREYRKLTGESAKPAKKKKKKPGKLVGVKLGKMLMSEEFSKPSSDWYMRDGWAFMEDGKYMMNSATSPLIARYKNAFRPANFYVETEIKLKGNVKQYSAGGLCFQVQSNQTFYLFMISPQGKFGAWAVKDGNKKDLTGKERSNAPVGTFECCVASKHINKGKAKNVIAVGIVGTKHFYYINKHMVFKCDDYTITNPGTLGCAVNTGSHTFSFDNFKTYEATLAR